MQLVIAEKPSVAKAIANVIGAFKRGEGYLEGSGYIVSWCIGHLVELAGPQEYDEKYAKWRIKDLPIVPEQWHYNVSSGTAEQFLILQRLMNRKDVEELIEATDAGREGELIFRLVYHKAGCKKPFRRLWISSMEDKAIREGFMQLKDSSEYDDLYDAAAARAKADWLIGINATRLFTKLYDKKLTVGRVQSPTLAMVVSRQKQINGFIKQKYWNVHLDLDGLDVVKEKIFSEEEAEEIVKKCRNRQAVITSAVNKEKTVSPPRLYDLTTLQREANRFFGYTAQNTLDYTQSLYEAKLVTYPRTDSQFLTDDMGETADLMTQLVQRIFGFGTDIQTEKDVHRVLNSHKVSDHHAIIPTEEVERVDLTKLSKGESDILMLISMRLMSASAGKQIISEVEIHAECEGEAFAFKGKKVLDPGWKAYEDEFRKRIGGKSSGEEKELPMVTEGQIFAAAEPVATEHFTSPPKLFTEDTLLSAMETAGNDSFEEDTEKKGLGTPATRAAMIEKLVNNHYIQRKGKQIIPTEDGMTLVEILPEEVKSPVMTAEWENTLMQIERGKESADKFLEEIAAMAAELVSKYGKYPGTGENPFGEKERPQKEQIGVCPRCGSPVYEGEKNYYCSNRECHFCIWKESRWLSGMRKKVTKSMASSLLRDGRVHVSGLYSERKGRCFDADLLLEDTGTYVNFKLDFAGGKAAKNKRKVK